MLVEQKYTHIIDFSIFSLSGTLGNAFLFTFIFLYAIFS